MHEVLKLLKLDLGISHDKRDAYLEPLLYAAKAELVRKRIVLDLQQADDVMLLSDYAAWLYRKRQEDVPLPNNLKWRLMNRKVQVRAGDING